MNENTPNADPSTPQPEPESRYEERRRRREARRAARGGYSASWILGGILIVLGVLFLLQNQGVMILQNWWALFILIPAFGSLAAAWRIYHNAGGRLTAGALGSLVLGFALLAVTAMFLFNLNWTILGPVLLILAGIGLLITVFLPK